MPVNPLIPETEAKPLITTKAAGEDGSKIIQAKQNVTIIDKVNYKNLITGKRYIVRGTLMNRVTGEPLSNAGKTIAAEREFVALTSNGEISVGFIFDASEFGDIDAVVFEKLYMSEEENEMTAEKLIASHEDFADEDQTVYIISEKVKEEENEKEEEEKNPEKPMTAEVPETGYDSNMDLLIMIMFTSIISIFVIFWSEKKRYNIKKK
jgi:hypothetical protein